MPRSILLPNRRMPFSLAKVIRRHRREHNAAFALLGAAAAARRKAKLAKAAVR